MVHSGRTTPWSKVLRARAELQATTRMTVELHSMARESQLMHAEQTKLLSALGEELRQMADELASLSEAIASVHAEVASLPAGIDRSVAHSTDLAETVDTLRSDLQQLTSEVERNQQRTMLALRMVRDDDASARQTLWSLRAAKEYEAAFTEAEPLVTMIIPTYSNWDLLGDRSIPSLVEQTYERWEAIIVGDGAPDQARRVVESFRDDRIQFVNLPYRGPYPDHSYDAWLVSGTPPFNTGLALAKGLWTGANDDDDALRPTHIESLLGHARLTNSEVSYGFIDQHEPDGPGRRLGVFPPVHGQWGFQSSLSHSALRFLPLQLNDWVFGISNDSSLLERMLRIGVRFSMLEETVVDYYPSQLWSEHESRNSKRERF